MFGAMPMRKPSGITPNSGCGAELDPLGQWQVVAVIDGVGLAPHIGAPAVRAAFPPAAGLLLATERPADLSAGRPDVHVGDAAIGAGGGLETLRLLQVICEDR